MKTETQYSIEETLENWLASKGVEVDDLHVKLTDDESGKPCLYFAKGTIRGPFEKFDDGNSLILAYHQDLVLTDQRFHGTVMIFPTDTTFRIV